MKIFSSYLTLAHQNTRKSFSKCFPLGSCSLKARTYYLLDLAFQIYQLTLLSFSLLRDGLKLIFFPSRKISQKEFNLLQEHFNQLILDFLGIVQPGIAYLYRDSKDFGQKFFSLGFQEIFLRACFSFILVRKQEH